MDTGIKDDIYVGQSVIEERGMDNGVRFTGMRISRTTWRDTLKDIVKGSYVTHLDETSHMSAEFVFRYGPKCMGGLILPILVLLHL